MFADLIWRALVDLEYFNTKMLQSRYDSARNNKKSRLSKSTLQTMIQSNATVKSSRKVTKGKSSKGLNSRENL